MWDPRYIEKCKFFLTKKLMSHYFNREGMNQGMVFQMLARGLQ